MLPVAACSVTTVGLFVRLGHSPAAKSKDFVRRAQHPGCLTHPHTSSHTLMHTLTLTLSHSTLTRTLTHRGVCRNRRDIPHVPRPTSPQGWTTRTISDFRFLGWQRRIRLCQTRNGSHSRPGFDTTLRVASRTRTSSAFLLPAEGPLGPLPSEDGTYKTVQMDFGLGLSHFRGESPCRLFPFRSTADRRCTTPESSATP